jgi:hypothetical protein
VAESTEILIGDAEGQHVLIQPLFRSHPGLFDYWDGNWIECDVHVAAGGFRGKFRASLRAEEFLSFLEAIRGLNTALEGTASFATMEEQVALSLNGDGKGHIRVSGEALDAVGIGNRLRFEFEVDQTYLPAICQSLEAILVAFPILDAPDT